MTMPNSFPIQTSQEYRQSISLLESKGMTFDEATTYMNTFNLALGMSGATPIAMLMTGQFMSFVKYINTVYAQPIDESLDGVDSGGSVVDNGENNMEQKVPDSQGED